jgi:hypothetical protein
MPREQPRVAGKVLDSILPFAVHRFLQILNNPSACGLHSLEMRIHVLYEHS